MANKIAVGETGQASFIETGSFEGTSTYQWNILRAHDAELIATSNAPNGWTTTSDGTVSIPSDFTGIGDIYDVYHSKQNGSRVDYILYNFEVVCITVDVNITKLSSAKISGSSPIQYRHKYAVEAKALGGTKPYSYSWSASSGSLSASGDSGILTITNSNPTAAGISATVTCDVTDSGTCSATDTASIVDGKPSIEGGGPCAGSGSSQKRCNAGGICLQSTGNKPVPSGGSNPQQYGHYGSHGS